MRNVNLAISYIHKFIFMNHYYSIYTNINVYMNLPNTNTWINVYMNLTDVDIMNTNVGCEHNLS